MYIFLIFFSLFFVWCFSCFKYNIGAYRGIKDSPTAGHQCPHLHDFCPSKIRNKVCGQLIHNYQIYNMQEDKKRLCSEGVFMKFYLYILYLNLCTLKFNQKSMVKRRPRPFNIWAIARSVHIQFIHFILTLTT